jgi:CDP-glucose 4,6-dehydratase
MDKNFWNGKKVFITGHTGFKGSWLSLVLIQLGAKIAGYSINIPTNPSLFTALELEQNLEHIIGDVADFTKLNDTIAKFNPDIVIHMAAQPLVRYSYQNPIETYQTNVMGTVNVLEVARLNQNIKGTVIITSDKCYDNIEHIWGYREHDPMGGFDPYSNSKGCAELVTSAYSKSYFIDKNVNSVASARAGNVIGGGDWADARLIPDIINSLNNNISPIIRSPNAIRPWQHVLEPLSGYMLVAEKIYNQAQTQLLSWNFGPNYTSEVSVINIVNQVCDLWGTGIKADIQIDETLHEAKLLTLDSTKARRELDWHPKWDINQTLEKTVKWYQAYHNNDDMLQFTKKQIQEYFNL